MKKTIKLLTILLTLILAFTFVGCKKNPVTVDENSVIITADFSDYDLEGKTLLEFMEILKSEGKLDFTISDGMVNSINGVANSANSYWMFYTDDTENSNEAWGTAEYNGKTYFSASLGVSDLPLKDGATYIIIYQTFEF